MLKTPISYLVGNAENSNLIAASVKFLHGGVVGVLVRHKEGPLGLAPVRVKSVLLKGKNSKYFKPEYTDVYFKSGVNLCTIWSFCESYTLTRPLVDFCRQ